ncbi:MAG: LuxR C-terminal-related transcriptional regulator [Anaerolineae bacterium]|nr:LuxR C-terminal-related transcriptional regulator [Anaerolineae bacterium]
MIDGECKNTIQAYAIEVTTLQGWKKGWNYIEFGYNEGMPVSYEPDASLIQPLTAREQDILRCLGTQMSNRQIAEHLTVSLNTVKWYVRQIYNKLGVNNRTQAVARARKAGLLPAAQIKTVRQNLPIAATPFVGREQELNTLAAMIADEQSRIVTIVGPGGSGKTRLALEMARWAWSDTQSRKLTFDDGVFFVPLAPLESPSEIVSTLAAVLGFQFQDARSESQQLTDYLQQKQMLLVFDNFEHIIDGRDFLTELSQKAAQVKLLVTSRERLQLLREQLFMLQGLGLPSQKHFDVEEITSYAAGQLFFNIARRTLPEFELLAGDGENILRICRLVDGMPLALELAASWVGLLPLSNIAAEIEHSLRFLSTERHDMPRRHRSIHAALDVSWLRLNGDQRRIFKQLTVFRGGFTREAAAEVAGATLPLLITLLNKSWLAYDPGQLHSFAK